MLQRFEHTVRLLERMNEQGYLKTLGQSVYSVQEAVPAYCDLADLKHEKQPLANFGCEIRLITQADQAEQLQYPMKSRGLQVKKNLRKGYRSFVIIKQDKIIGDIWFTRANATNRRPHKDLEVLGIDLGPQDAYAFDLYVSKQERGKDLTTSFMTNALRELRSQGVSRVYGYYRVKNIPALWIHRLIGYKEMPKVRIRNFLWFRTSLPPTDRANMSAR